jgi:hypothetical protein
MRLGQQPWPAHQHLVAIDRGLDSLASNRVECGRFGQRQPARLGPVHHGLAHVYVRDGVIRLQVSGSTNALIKALAAAQVPSIQLREPTLEELFHAYYDESTTAPTGA